MRIAILLYQNMTALDAIGPYELLSRLPGVQLDFVALEAGPITTDTGFLTLLATHSIREVDAADVVLVPGGMDAEMRETPEVLDWLRRIDATTTWTTSVCTGALILAAAGLLEGRKATTHWAMHEVLKGLGAEPVKERTVVDGKYVTAAGVSAGIDMAIGLVARIQGEDYARALQLGIEYDPAPPFDAGSPDKVTPEIMQMTFQALTNPNG